MEEHTDILVAGAGAAGLTAALALARTSFRVTVVGPPDVGGSARTVALFDGSIRFLDNIDAWASCADAAAALRVMRIVDRTGSIFAPPPASFPSTEIGLDAFGWNIENRVLVSRLADLARAHPGIRFIEDFVGSYAFERDCVRVRTKGGEAVSASLVVAADGRSSPAREAARITTTTWRYPQVALTAIFAHDMPHKDTSTEFHTRQGPCTFVPLPGTAEHPNRSSLVWMMSPEEADRRAALPAEAFAREASETGLRHLGALRLISQRGRVPMQGLTARRLTGARIALVGEAAHAFPPIGAQGLNLGLRDVAHLAEALEGAAAGDDAGAPARLAVYERLRRADVGTRTMGVDTLNRALLNHHLPMDFLRGAGLFALSSIGPLRRMAMREGVLPSMGAPRVMRQRPAPVNT